MLNDDQKGHVRYVASLPPERRCPCGWFEIGDCYGPDRCNERWPGESLAERDMRRKRAEGKA